MKRIFIVHGWDFNPRINWYPWLKKELENKGYAVVVPEMPNTSEPDVKEWVSYLNNAVGKLDEETYFVGHSISCQAIMRFLEKEKSNVKISKIFFVAGWFKLGNLEDEEVAEIARPWLETFIDFNKIKNKISKLTVLLSSNEPYNYLKENEELFREKLKAKVIILKNKGHFTQEDGVTEIKEILNEF